MHIAKDYPRAIEFMQDEVGGWQLINQKELIILFVDKYKDLLNEVKTMQELSQKEKEQCQKKLKSKTQLKSKKPSQNKKK